MRKSGILLPISSLPGKYGIGCFSKEAYHFLDFLKAAGQHYWQILPLGPTGYGDSPYQSFSTFAGNPYFIDLQEFIDRGWLTEEECAVIDNKNNYVEYGELYENRYPLLKKAFEKFCKWEGEESEKEKDNYLRFQEENRSWLEDYALFMAVKNVFEGVSWIEWPVDIRYRWDYAMNYYRTTYKEEAEFYKFLQYIFFKQWMEIKKYAKSLGIEIIGDIPIYVAYDSADVWAHPELFLLTEGSRPAAVAGCPPDGFSPTGQLWGNPLYRWDYHRQTGYAWWIDRMQHCYQLYDMVRIDHFRGFDEYYSIPAEDETAVNGHWEKGPGLELFRAIEEKLGRKPVIAEDLGYLTPSVRRMVKDSGFPGMKVLEFAFDARDSSGFNDYLPHNYDKNCVVYTGTHDNETLRGWLDSITKEELCAVRRYLGRNRGTKEALCRELIRIAVSSVADTCVIPIQDWLLLDNRARINFPSTLGDNWKWRLKGDELTEELAEEIRSMNQIYARV